MHRILWLALLANSAILAVEDDFSLRVWRTDDGLPQNRVQALAQTAEGYLWVGTPAGLARFDGLRFTVFDRSNTPSFRDDSILSLCLDSSNGLWIGTEGGGLLHYKQGAFQSYANDKRVTNSFVRSLHCDSQGQLWIGTDRGFFFRDAAGQIYRLDGHPDLPEAAVTNIRADRAGQVWATSNQGVLRVGTRQAHRYRPPGFPTNTSRALLADSRGTLWFSRRGEIRRDAPGQPSQLIAVGQNTPLTLLESGGEIWLGTMSSGLLHLRGSQFVPAPIPGLPDQSVLVLMEDRDHSLWIGTPDGLACLTRSSIQTWTRRSGLPNDNIVTIYEDRDGSLWLGAITGEMARLAPNSSQLTPVAPPINGFHPRMVYRTRSSDLWFAASEGLVRQSGTARKFFGRADGLRSPAVRQLLEDQSGRLWAGLGSGLALLEGERFRTLYLEDGLPYGSVRCLLELPDGDLLVGTDGGLGRLREGKFIHDDSLAPLRGEKIYGLVLDPSGSLWIGTRGAGLYRLRSQQLTRITARDGLPGNNLYHLLDDRQGNLWMSGSFGIATLPWQELNLFADGRSEAIAPLSYGIAEGLVSTEMSGGFHPSATVSRSGDIWFASVKGAVRLRPLANRPDHRAQVLIEALRVEEASVPLTQPLQIPPGHNRIQIAFTACDLLAAPHLKLRYKLDGFDPNWSTDLRRRTATYTNLPPGNYTFRVAQLGGAAKESSLAFEVRPRFYQTSLFYLLLAALSAILIWGSFQLYARQTRTRYALLLAERTRLAREMHDTVIQGCVGVSTLLEAATPQSPEFLDLARHQIRQTIDEAREAVWDLRHPDSSGNLAATLRDFAGRFSHESRVPIDLEISGSIVRLDERAERNLLLVAREAIRNSISHAAPARIDLKLRYDSSGVCLEVRDDGKGFRPSVSPQAGHFGILGMRERVEALGGSLEIQSEPGAGTRLLATMPLELHSS